MSARRADRGLHGAGQVAQGGDQRRVDGATDLLGDRPGEQEPGGDLRVEGLGGRHAHLHVAAVRRVEHAVALVGEVGATPVDDGEHRGAAVAHEVDRAVGVGGGAGLADGDHEGVAHVRPQPEPGELGGRERLHPEPSVRDAGEQRARQALAGHVGRALADHLDAVDAAVAQPLAHAGREHVVAQRDVQRTVAVDELAAERLAEAVGRLGDLLEEEVRVRAAVDVAGGDLRVLEVGVGDREHGAVVGLAHDAVEGAGAGSVEHHDLPAAGVGVVGVGRGVAVEPQVARRELHQPVGLRRDDVAAIGQPDVERLAAAAQREQEVIGVRPRRWPRWRPSPRSRRRCRGRRW